MSEYSDKKTLELADTIAANALLLKAEVVRLRTIAEQTIGVVQVLEPYPVETECRNKRIEYLRKETLDKLYADSLSVWDRNKVKLAANLALKNTLQTLLERVGIPDRVRVGWSGTSRNQKAVYGGWSDSLKFIPVTDDFPQVTRLYNETLSQLKAAEDRKQAERDAAEWKRAEEQRKIKAAANTMILCEKYGIPDGDVRDIRDALLEKNKYLRLAYWLERNRNDWNEGYSYAEVGLDGFKIESPEDKEIDANIRQYIEDWDGDGRVFRDCTWNYDVLYAKASAQDPSLYADFQKLREHLPFD